MFISLALLLGVGPAIVFLVFRNKVKETQRIICAFLTVVIFGLAIGTLVNEIIGYAEEMVCLYVALGLGCGAALLGVIVLIATLTSFEKKDKTAKEEPREEKREEPVKVSKTKNSGNMDYIAEIKALKELLDDGAITKEEYDKKKKEILER